MIKQCIYNHLIRFTYKYIDLICKYKNFDDTNILIIALNNVKRIIMLVLM